MSISSRLSVSHLPALLAGVGIAIAASFFFASHALAAAPTMTAATADTNNNGTIDRITITFSELVDIDDGNAGNGFASIALGSGCTIANGDYNNDSTLTLTFSGLTGCTAGDTALRPTVTYTAVADCTTANSICDAAGANQMANGQNTTSADTTGPIINAAVVSRTTSGGITYNSIQLTYTEDIQVSGNAGGAYVTTNVASSATLGALTTTRLLDGLASWAATNGGDMTVSAATNNTVTVDNTTNSVTITFNTAAAGFFTSGTTAPTTTDFTTVSDVNDLKDLATSPNAANASAAVVTATVGTAWDVTAPTISTTYSCDVDGDGDIEIIQAIFNENVVDAGTGFGVFEGDNDSSNDGVGEITATAVSSTANCDGSSNAGTNDTELQFTVGAGITGTEAAFLNVPSAGGRDHAGNRLAAVAGGGTETDKAAPRLMVQSPSSGQAGVTNTSNIVITFSEAINTSTDAVTFSPNVANADAWTSGNTVLTIDPTSVFLPGTVTVTVTTAADTAGSPNAFGGTNGSTVNPWNFFIASNSSGSSGGGTTPTPNTITVTSPDVVEEHNAGDNMLIEWNSTGNTMSNVNLYYSIDGGANYTEFVHNGSNNGFYLWTVPNVDTDSAYIKIEGTDLVTVLATDISSQFQITTGTTSTPDNGPTNDDGTSNAPSSGDTGPSPVTGEIESISTVNVGDYIKSPYFSTVYYVDTGMIRRPFMDSQTYMTYENSFAAVLTVTDATLPTMALGPAMLPKAGVVLVKITSDNHVYATVNDGMGNTQLRWITSEEVARDLYGSFWADYVIDVDVTLFSKYTMGADVEGTGDLDVNMSQMKTRAEVNS